jgi:hypothetical protein
MTIYVLSSINTRREYVQNDSDILTAPLAFDNIDDCKLWAECCAEGAPVEWFGAPFYDHAGPGSAWSATVGALIYVIRQMPSRAELFQGLLPEYPGVPAALVAEFGRHDAPSRPTPNARRDPLPLRRCAPRDPANPARRDATFRK